MPQPRRKTPIIPTLEGPEAIEAEMAEYARLHNELLAIEAGMNDEMARIRAKHESRIVPLRAQLDHSYRKMALWAQVNQATAFGALRSRKLLHGTIGFRLGNKTISAEKGYTLETCLEAVLRTPRLLPYVRTKQEMDRAAMLADYLRTLPEPDGDRLHALTDADLAAAHLRVTRAETFFAEPHHQQIATP